MRVLMLEAPADLLDERQRLGLDVRDELWNGVLHVVPPPSERHQDLNGWLVELLRPIARQAKLKCSPETGLFAPGRAEYRVPDVVVYGTEVASERGVEGGAHTVIEIRSPDDESYDKIPWYLDVGVREVVIIDRDTLTVEVFCSLDASTGLPVLAHDTAITSLDVTLERIDDDHLAVIHPDGTRRSISL